MTPRNNAHDHAKLQALISTAAPGTLWDSITEAFGFTGRSGVKRLIIRLRDAGFDMAAYDAAVKARYSQRTETQMTALRQGRERRRAELPPKAAAPKAAPVESRHDQQYALLMQAAATAMPGRLTRTAMDLLNTQAESTVGCIVRRLKKAGYDMGDWDAAGRVGQAMGSRMHRPRAAVEVPEHVIARRAEWLTDMRVVTRMPGAIEQLADRWNCDRATVYNRIAALRGLGHDLSWWRPSARPNAPTPSPAPVVVAPPVLTLPVVEIQARPSRYAAPVPWTMQAVADIAGVTVLRAMWVGRQHGIPFETVTLDEATAMGLLSALGFTPHREAA